MRLAWADNVLSPICNFAELHGQARALDPLAAAVVAAGEAHVVEAALHAAQEGLIAPVLIGRRDIIDPICRAAGGTLPVIEAGTDDEAARLAVLEVQEGRARMLIKGHLHTAAFLHPIVRELHGSTRISHVFVGELSNYPRLLMITDAAINIAPDLMAKADILHNALVLARALGEQMPRVAVLSALEDINPAIVSTLDAAALAKMADRGHFGAALVDGPLAFDNAISLDATAIKGIKSQVAGQADILLMPDLVSGNVLYKALAYLANARFAGMVLGAGVPIVLTSRADSTQARLDSIALARVVHARTSN